MAEEKTNKIDPFHYIGILRRRKWLIIIPLVISYIAFFIHGLTSPRIYEAQAIVLIEEQQVVNPLLSNLAVSRTVSSKMTALSEEILAWPRIYQLVERLELNKNIKDPLELERLIAGIRKNIILRMKSSEVLTIAFRGENAKGTQELTNTLCDILIQRSESLSEEDTASAIDFINEQLALYKVKVEDSDKKLREFREVYGQDSSSVTKLPLDKINDEIAKYEADLVMAYVDCTDDHPRVQDLKRRIEDLKVTRNEYIQELATKAGVAPDSYINIADSTPRQQEELVRLTRDKTVNEKLYAMFLERLEAAKITESLDQSENRTKFRIIEPARLPLSPVEPDMAKLNLLGILVGIMVGFGAVYGLEYIDSSCKSEADITEQFGVKVLGSVAKIISQEQLAQSKERTKKIVKAATIFFVIVFVVLLVLAHVAGA